MYIQKLNPETFSQAFGILCQSVYPDAAVGRTPFGSMWCIVEPGKTANAHNHHEAETFIIMQGSGVLTVDEERATVEPGDVIYLPPLSKHALKNTSPTETLRFLSVYWEDLALLDGELARKAQAPQRAPQRVLITATPPTPNGDLHLGHLSGPYLAADIYTRYLRMCGADAYYISGIDDHQSYVKYKGFQIGLDSAATADQFGDAMIETLYAANIQPDLVARPRTSPYHIQFVQDFFTSLYNNGKFITRDADSLYCDSCKLYLFEVHVRGTCPHCGSGTAGNACEECGRPNDCVDLIEPSCKYCDQTPTVRAFKRLYFPLSQYQAQLEAYYASVNMGPHLRALCDRMIADGLPDIAISHVADWGIPVPVAGFEEQRLYVWFEMAPGYLSATHELQRVTSAVQGWKDLWQADDGQVVQFFGFDNGYFHAVLFPALFLAYHEAVKLPATFVSNEFYRLDNLKFSTSRMHAIWGRELIAQMPADVVRFYLAYDRPETEQTSFTLEAFKQVVQRELVEGWQDWLHALGAKLAQEFDGIAPEAGAWSDDHQRFYQQLKQSTQGVSYAYTAETFSPQHVTRLLCELVRTARRFGKAEDHLRGVAQRRDLRRTAVALELAAARALALLAGPIMPEFASQLWQTLTGQPFSAARWEAVPAFVPGGRAIPALDRLYFPDTAQCVIERH